MATSKTGSFWLTENVETQASGLASGTIDLGAYVDVGDQQAVAIEQVDFIWQRQTIATGVFDGNIPGAATADNSLDAQLSDLNPGGEIIRADDNNLIASGTLLITDTGGASHEGVDLYPDIFGKLDESRMVVNDQLYVVTDVNSLHASYYLNLTVRIKARIVKLATKDWMAIAIQSTASDN